MRLLRLIGAGDGRSGVGGELFQVVLQEADFHASTAHVLRFGILRRSIGRNVVRASLTEGCRAVKRSGGAVRSGGAAICLAGVDHEAALFKGRRPPGPVPRSSRT